MTSGGRCNASRSLCTTLPPGTVQSAPAGGACNASRRPDLIGSEGQTGPFLTPWDAHRSVEPPWPPGLSTWAEKHGTNGTHDSTHHRYFYPSFPAPLLLPIYHHYYYNQNIVRLTYLPLPSCLRTLLPCATLLFAFTCFRFYIARLDPGPFSPSLPLYRSLRGMDFCS